MKTIAMAGWLAVSLLLGACKSSETTEETATADTTQTAPPPAATPTNVPAAATTAKAAATPAHTSKPAAKQKGLEKGKAILGYMQDTTDPGICGAVTDADTKKLSDKERAELATALKGKWVDACPMTDVVLTCKAPFGLLLNYSGPKYTAATAKKHCAKSQGTPVR